MELVILLNTTLLCTVNTIFMLTGIFLNSTVILCFWRSGQLRNKLCYFMILVLACFDFAVVIITHPLIMLSTISWCIMEYEIFHTIRLNISALFYGSSLLTLLIMNVERYIALTYPYFHQRFVTRKRLIALLFLHEVLGLVQLTLSYRDFVFPAEVAPACFLGILFFVLFFINYKIFIIARRIRENDNRVAASLGQDEGDYPAAISALESKLTLKKISTCLLAALCFFLCSCPGLLHNCVLLVSKSLLSTDVVLGWGLWSSTLVSMNSTFNCLIFFWKNTTLQNEGNKILKRRSHLFMKPNKVVEQTLQRRHETEF
jgi:hypothetical protein